MTATTTLDLDATKARQKAMWMMCDFGQIARFTEDNASGFVRRLAVGQGMRVLDVACGTGNVAIPAAEAGAIVSAIDIAPNLLEQARLRARREGLDISFREGDMEDLPYLDGAFDLVVSTFGIMFATRPKRVAQELTRVCKRGGRIALANWTARGFVGQIHEVGEIPARNATCSFALSLGRGDDGARAVARGYCRSPPDHGHCPTPLSLQHCPGRGTASPVSRPGADDL
jgi:SAM-dependent methyltransferase